MLVVIVVLGELGELVAGGAGGVGKREEDKDEEEDDDDDKVDEDIDEEDIDEEDIEEEVNMLSIALSKLTIGRQDSDKNRNAPILSHEPSGPSLRPSCNNLIITSVSSIDPINIHVYIY